MVILQPEFDIGIKEAVASSERIRCSNRDADAHLSLIAGLESVIGKFETALAENTYPFVGKGEVLCEGHRKYLEDDLNRFRARLAAERERRDVAGQFAT